MSKKEFGEYTTEELEDKIQWEGFDYFFTGYSIPEDFVDTPIEEEVRNFVDAYNALQDKLRELGIDTEEM